MARSIPALLPRGQGHQFVLYGDSCSGVPGALHERTFASVNAVVRRLQPAPDFILFPGDEVIGLTPDADALKEQWRHWLETEMAWLDRETTPIWHTTGNHTTYDTMSEAVFREVLGMPRNGPPGHAGLSYFVRRGDLLMVFIHTLWSGAGGEGHIETEWLEATLLAHRDAAHKLVLGHHPVFPINGFSGPYQREIGPEHTRRFWDLLADHKVLAYLCSHILAFDVQAHRGVLQICTAGAGTAHRMPEGAEYLHCVQAALDAQGLRYQVLDMDGAVREQLSWPLRMPAAAQWQTLPIGQSEATFGGLLRSGSVVHLTMTGRTCSDLPAPPQTLFSAFSPGSLALLWLGLRGPHQTLTLIMGRDPGRSPHYWIGPDLGSSEAFDLHIALYPDMGPGGILYRLGEDKAWASFSGASPHGLERLEWPPVWSAGNGQSGSSDRAFRGEGLSVQVALDSTTDE
jgi:hypothetical protein